MAATMMLRRRLWAFIAAVCLLFLVAAPRGAFAADDVVEEEEKRRSIRLKTTGQLKKIFQEMGVNYQESMSKTQLQELAYEEDAVERWLERHPEKRRKKATPPAGFGEKPDGMDSAQWERLLEQMQNKKQANFDHIADPERRSILTKLAAAGLVMPGSEDMEMEKLRNLGKILDGIPDMGGGAAKASDDAGDEETEEEENVQEL